MKPDTLENLLRDTDTTAGPAHVEAGLAKRIPRLAARRRARRMAITGVAAVVVLLVGAATVHLSMSRSASAPRLEQSIASGRNAAGDAARKDEPLPAPSPVAEVEPPAREMTPDELKARVAQLEAEARVRDAVIRQLLAREQRDRTLAKLARLEASQLDRPVDEQVEKAAIITVAQGDRLRETDASAAAASYRQVLALFPQTRSADIARQRLDELNAAPAAPTDNQHDGAAPVPRPSSFLSPAKGNVI